MLRNSSYFILCFIGLLCSSQPLEESGTEINKQQEVTNEPPLGTSNPVQDTVSSSLVPATPNSPSEEGTPEPAKSNENVTTVVDVPPVITLTAMAEPNVTQTNEGESNQGSVEEVQPALSETIKKIEEVQKKKSVPKGASSPIVQADSSATTFSSITLPCLVGLFNMRLLANLI